MVKVCPSWKPGKWIVNTSLGSEGLRHFRCHVWVVNVDSSNLGVPWKPVGGRWPSLGGQTVWAELKAAASLGRISGY